MKSGKRAGLGADDDLSILILLLLFISLLFVCDFLQGFDIDFSKLRHKFETGAVDLDDDDLKCC